MRLIPTGKSAVDAADTRIMLGSVVEYEQHGSPILGIVSTEKKGKWGVTNGKGAQLDLSPERLYLLPGKPSEDVSDSARRVAFLTQLEKDVAAAESKIDLEELWNLLSGDRSEIGTKELTELALGTNTLVHHAAMRRALLHDTVFFKRAKSTFQLRPEDLVKELKEKRDVELAAARERALLRDGLVLRILGKPAPDILPENIRLLEEFAALGKSAQNAKDAITLVEELEALTRVSLNGHAQDKAFQLLVLAKHFEPDEDLNFIRHGRMRRFSDKLHREMEALLAKIPVSAENRADLRHLDTFTIDGAATLDRDDALSLEKTEKGFRIGIHISDITPWLNQSVFLEHEAKNRATSIYAPDYTVPMLPKEISEGAFSLLPGQDRLATTFFVELTEQGEILGREVDRSVIRVRAHLSYPEADAILFGENRGAKYETELMKLWDLSLHLERSRLDRGAMQFSSKEMFPKILPDRTVVLENSMEDTPAHKMIGEMMVLANETAALIGAENHIPMVYRSQEPPDVNLDEQGLDIPEGPARDFYRRSMLKRSTTSASPNSHYGLGLASYVQITSPIRRYVDLVNQRQLVSFLEFGKPWYSTPEVEELIETVRAGLDTAWLIQRERTRFWLLVYLEQQAKTEVEGLIIKTDGPKPLVELDDIFLFVPFHPAGAKDPEALKARRGHKIRLSIEQLNSRKDTFILREAAK